MRYVQKSKEGADHFKEYTNDDQIIHPDRYANSPNTKWSFFTTDMKKELYKDLIAEQKGLCIYCEQSLSEDYDTKKVHIEHIRPKSRYENLIFDYNNLAASCNGYPCDMECPEKIEEFCGHNKGSEYDEANFLNPVEIEDIEKYFEYDAEAKIYPTSEDRDKANKAEYMISILGLNNTYLLDARRRILDKILEIVAGEEKIDLGDDIIIIDINNEDEYKVLPAYYTMLKFLKQIGVIQNVILI